MKMNLVKCDMCSSTIPTKPKDCFYHHMNIKHRISTKFYTRCKFVNCTQVFHLFSSFKRHWYKHHFHDQNASFVNSVSANIIDQDSMLRVPTSTDLSTNESPVLTIETAMEVVPVLNMTNHQDSTMISLTPYELAGSLSDEEFLSGILLFLRQKYFLPFTALSFVKSAIDEMCDRKIQSLQRNLHGILPTSKTEERRYNHQFHLAQHHFPFTRSQMETSWTKNFPTVNPIPVSLSKAPTEFQWTRGRDGRLLLRSMKYLGYIIPFSQSLQQVLSIKYVYDSILLSFENNKTRLINGHPTDKTISDFWDGEFIRTNSIFLENQGEVIVIQVYYDEVETANGLGSKKGKHKVGVFYYSILNLPPDSRSNLRSINLLGIIPCKLLKQYGVRAFLKPFLDDLEKLQTGVKLNVRNDNRSWHVTIGNVVGDMPASNLMGGFKESSALANRPCRICLVSRNELDSIHHERDCNLRDQVIHETQLSKVLDENLTADERNGFSVKYGINGESPFAVLKAFDVTKCFPHDVMHVFFEGIMNSETGLLLNKLICEGIIDLEKINAKISTLKSGRQFTKPPPIRLDEVKNVKKLSMSSSEMLCLTLVLPFVLSEYCSCENNSYFANYILLVKIASCLTSYHFTESDIEVLKFDIFHHNVAFCKLYPKINKCPVITPKLHSLIHLPGQIRLFGPPRYFWCFRYESKNAPLKKVMRRVSNFLNVPFTLASNIQKLMALDVRQDGEGDFFGMQQPNIKLRVIKTTNRNTKKDYWIETMKTSNILNPERFSKSVQSIVVSGRICGEGTVFLRSRNNSDDDEYSEMTLPQFWRISEIIAGDCDEFVYIMKELSTLMFNIDTFSFIVDPLPTFCCIVLPSSHALKYPVPLHSFEYNNQLHIVPNYYNIS